MALAPGTRLGPYAITAPIGAGGMGEVYKATDTRLDRTVAVKVLPEHVASDPDLKQRFEREAKTLAALSHPHICPVFDVGSQDGIAFLVMEYLEGETLEQRLKKGALSLDHALQIGIQIADALSAAHRAGIVHRDLKPGNIMLTKSGSKLLDFGLAKTGAPAVAGSLSMLPTTPPGLTQQGAILGTFQYMAPEQLEGREADVRTDIFAFGVVVYEMVTGKKAFEGKSQASLIAAIMSAQPPSLVASQPLAPPLFEHLVQRCLAKDPDERWQTASDLVGELRWAADNALAPAQPGVARGLRLRSAGPMYPWLVTGAVGAVLIGVVILSAPWRTSPVPAPVRFGIVVPQPITPSVNDRQLAISPDGTRIAYVSAGANLGSPITMRSLDRLETETLRGVSEARVPFFSADGRSIGFFEGASELKTLSLEGGPPVTLTKIVGTPRGASWADNNTIVYATADAATGLLQISAAGGEPRVLTRPDSGEGERDHLFPAVLPGSRAVLFTVLTSAKGGAELSSNLFVAALDIETGERKILIRGATQAEYVETGHLLYTAEGTLFAARFDPVRLVVLSDPIPIMEGIAMANTQAAQYSVSRTGTLVYMPDSGAATSRSLVWVSRDGHEEPVTAPSRGYYALRLSPDGVRVALDIRDQDNDVWVWDFRGQTLTRLTFNPSNDVFPVWTPDGTTIVFRGPDGLFQRPADGTGSEQQLTSSIPAQFAMSFSPDGKQLVITDSSGGGDLQLLSMEKKAPPMPLVSTAFTEGLAEVSPDGRWLAYQSNESGRDEVYVRPFPNVNGGRWQVSSNGGSKPLWARSGRELFYIDGAGALVTVGVQATGGFSVGSATRLLETRFFSALQARSYDVSPDGARFLFIKETPTATSASSPNIVVVLHWLEELKRRVPAN
jgi:serine/threonine-protein kinase